jgi:hypothetical protein
MLFEDFEEKVRTDCGYTKWTRVQGRSTKAARQ